MSLKISRSLAAGFVTAALAVSLAVPAAAAASRDKHAAVAAHRAHHAYAAHRWHDVAHRGSAPLYNYALPQGAIVMPGYVFVPGKGILDEACNLPTSACPNSERDIQ